MKYILHRFILLFSFCLLVTGIIFAQEADQIKVTGQVFSITSGDSLEGINVSVLQAPGIAATSNQSGEFEISVPNKNATLVFSYPDYKTQNVSLGGRINLQVLLVEAELPSFTDVFNVAYGTKSKQHFTEGISVVPEHILRSQSDETFETMISGMASGAHVIRRSGFPGSGAEIYIRGTTSINAGNKPLYVIDGLILKSDLFENTLSLGTPYNPLMDINPDDIESVTILKDGYATSMYGARAANGVILINTYQGSQGASTLDLNTYGGISLAPENLPLLNASQYRELFDELGFPSNLTPVQIQKTYGPMLDSDPGTRYDNDTDWQNELFNRSAVQNYHLRLKGGDGISKYMFTVGYTGKNGIIDNSSLKRLTSRFNLDYLITSKLTFQSRIAYTNSNLRSHDQGNSIYNPIYLATTKSPIFEPVNHELTSLPLDSADFLGKSNPMAVVKGLENSNIVNRFIGTATLLYDFTPSINLSSTFGMDYFRLRENRFIPATGIAKYKSRKNQTSLQVSKEHMFTNQTLLSFNKRLDYIHSLSFVLGAAYQTNMFQTDYGAAINTPSDEFTSLGSGAKMDSIGFENGRWNTISYFGNANYSLLDKYLLSANLRIDGSSRFGQNNKLGYFPGVALGWIISSESFMDNIQLINLLKLRTSYGISGNDNIGNYSALAFYIPANYQLMGGYRQGNLRNPDLRWEQTAQLDIGVDLSILGQRLNVTTDYYHKITSDLLTYESIPWESGFDFRIVNLGKIKNTGFEIGVDARILDGELKWNLGGNLTKNKNTITDLPDGDVIHSYGIYEGLAREGESLGAIYGYKTNGIYQNAGEINLDNASNDPSGYGYSPFQPGDIIFEDLNKDGYINKLDKTIIGNALPDFYGGAFSSIDYKGFNLTAIFSYSAGNDAVNGLKSILQSMSTYDNQSADIADRWTTSGDQTDIPRAALGDPSGNSRMSDRWIEDGSYIRLKTATVSYSFPAGIIDKIFVRNMTVYVSGQNLFNTGQFSGYDPEFSTTTDILHLGLYYAGYPHTRCFMAGIKVGF